MVYGFGTSDQIGNRSQEWESQLGVIQITARPFGECDAAST